MGTLLKIEFFVPEAELEYCQAFLAEAVAHGWEEAQQGDRVRLTVHLEDHTLGRDLADRIRDRWPDSDCRAEERESEDWGLAWKDFFQPICTGERFEILPPWLADKGDPGYTPIVIEPKMAFGTGHHPTTAMCMAALADLSREGRLAAGQTFYDLGTGTGILAIALAKLGLTGLAVDIDPQAVACARENIQANGVAQSVRLAAGSADCLAEGSRFDAVVANILSGPLIELSGDVVRAMKPGGVLVLSGLLSRQAESVTRAYMSRGLGRPRTMIDGEWAALVW